MIFTQLTLKNYGPYKEEYTFDLKPKIKYEKYCPIILFGGLNGAGKTSIIESINIALYGKPANSAMGKVALEKYLESKMHRYAAISAINPAMVSLTFEHPFNGKIKEFEMTRTWYKKGAKIIHDLTVIEDGGPLKAVVNEGWDDFIKSIVPPGISNLFFFDAERIQELASDSDEDISLKNAMKELLGLEIVERLGNDMKIYSNRLEEQATDKESQALLNEIKEKLIILYKKEDRNAKTIANIKADLNRIETDISQVEESFKSKGGEWALKRDELVQDKAKTEEALKMCREQLKDLCRQTLPLAVSNKYKKSLEKQIKIEDEIKLSTIKTNVLSEFSNELKKTINRRHKAIGNKKTVSLINELIDMNLNGQSSSKPKGSLILDFSERARKEVESQISESKHSLSTSKTLLKKNQRAPKHTRWHRQKTSYRARDQGSFLRI